jgi:mRNA interferase MazF
MKKGDIILLPFPFTDLSGNKTRPALVLISNTLDVTVAFITTQIAWQEPNDLLLSANSKNGLKRNSLVRLSKLATIDSGLVLGKLGELSANELNEIDHNLVIILQINI